MSLMISFILSVCDEDCEWRFFFFCRVSSAQTNIIIGPFVRENRGVHLISHRNYSHRPSLWVQSTSIGISLRVYMCTSVSQCSFFRIFLGFFSPSPLSNSRRLTDVCEYGDFRTGIACALRKPRRRWTSPNRSPFRTSEGYPFLPTWRLSPDTHKVSPASETTPPLVVV